MFNAAIEGFVVLKPNSNGLYAAREQIRCVANGMCISPDDADYLLIAVGEAISNAYRHGSPNPATDLIRLSWHQDTSGLIITIKDNGRGFSAAQRLCASKAASAALIGCLCKLVRTAGHVTCGACRIGCCSRCVRL